MRQASKESLILLARSNNKHTKTEAKKELQRRKEKEIVEISEEIIG